MAGLSLRRARGTAAALALLCGLAAGGADAQEQGVDERGQLVFRMADKYEIYVREETKAAYIMRRYTYVVDRNVAGYDVVYLCWSEKTANSRMEEFVAELERTGAVEARRFNVMDMRLLSARDGAYLDEALFLKYARGRADVWRVSLSNTLLVYQQEVAGFRRQYEFF